MAPTYRFRIADFSAFLCEGPYGGNTDGTYTFAVYGDPSDTFYRMKHYEDAKALSRVLLKARVQHQVWCD